MGLDIWEAYGSMGLEALYEAYGARSFMGLGVTLFLEFLDFDFGLWPYGFRALAIGDFRALSIWIRTGFGSWP